MKAATASSNTITLANNTLNAVGTLTIASVPAFTTADAMLIKYGFTAPLDSVTNLNTVTGGTYYYMKKFPYILIILSSANVTTSGSLALSNFLNPHYIMASSE